MRRFLILLLAIAFLASCVNDRSGEGEICGGKTNLDCSPNLVCKVEGDSNASGVCVRNEIPKDKLVEDIKQYESLKQYESQINYSCGKNEDCVIKDVHNCCGYYPKCVNINAAVDPQKVKEFCKSGGRVSVCGFPSVSSCTCADNICVGNS